MLHRLDLANRLGLFTNYSTWYDDNEYDKSHLNIAFRISTLIISIENSLKYEKECINQFQIFENSLSQNKKIKFQSPTMYDIFNNLSTALSSIVILQDMISPIVQKEELKITGKKQEFKNKMREFMDKINTYKINSEVKYIIQGYWNAHGKLVRDYRNIDQHHYLLFDQTMIVNYENPKLVILLPDNPITEKGNTTSFKNLSFEKRINFIDFIKNELYAINDLINNISKEYGYFESVFYNNISVSTDQSSALSILFDPYKNYMIGTEVCLIENQLHTHNHLVTENLEKFSFVKLPENLGVTQRFEKQYIIK